MNKPLVSIDEELAAHADAIRMLGKRVVGDVVEIGKRLTKAKLLCGHGGWLSWLDQEFGWSHQTAGRFVHVYEMSKSNNLDNLEVPISGLYLLAAPSTPEEVRETVFAAAEAGERITTTKVRAAIADTHVDSLGRQQPARKPARVYPGHDLDESAEIEHGLNIFKWLSLNGRVVLQNKLGQLIAAWKKGAPDDHPAIEPWRHGVSIFRRLDQDDRGKMLDAIDQIYTNENADQ